VCQSPDPRDKRYRSAAFVRHEGLSILIDAGPDFRSQMLAADIAYAEQIKQMLMDDVAQRGIGQERYNGRQKYWQENKSLTQLRSFSDQQRKHLAELKLTPAKRHSVAVDIDDDFDDFD
jgi:hypothetical protein